MNPLVCRSCYVFNAIFQCWHHRKPLRGDKPAQRQPTKSTHSTTPLKPSLTRTAICRQCQHLPVRFLLKAPPPVLGGVGGGKVLLLNLFLSLKLMKIKGNHPQPLLIRKEGGQMQKLNRTMLTVPPNFHVNLTLVKSIVRLSTV